MSFIESVESELVVILNKDYSLLGSLSVVTNVSFRKGSLCCGLEFLSSSVNGKALLRESLEGPHQMMVECLIKVLVSFFMSNFSIIIKIL